MFQSLSNVPYPSVGRRAALGLKELSVEAGEQSLLQLWAAPVVNGQREHSALESAFCTLWAEAPTISLSRKMRASFGGLS